MTSGSDARGRATPGTSATGPGASTGPRARVEGFGRAERLLAEGDRKAAARLLRKLATRHPKNALIPYTLAGIHLDWRSPFDAMRAFRDAVRKDPAYGRDERLQRHAIATLSSASGHREAARLLVDIGEPVVPRLRKVAEGHSVSLMRERAAAVLQRIGH